VRSAARGSCCVRFNSKTCACKYKPAKQPYMIRWYQNGRCVLATGPWQDVNPFIWFLHDLQFRCMRLLNARHAMPSSTSSVAMNHWTKVIHSYPAHLGFRSACTGLVIIFAEAVCVPADVYYSVKHGSNYWWMGLNCIVTL